MTLAGSTLPEIAFDGGQGDDAILGDDSNHTWFITDEKNERLAAVVNSKLTIRDESVRCGVFDGDSPKFKEREVPIGMCFLDVCYRSENK